MTTYSDASVKAFEKLANFSDSLRRTQEVQDKAPAFQDDLMALVLKHVDKDALLNRDMEKIARDALFVYMACLDQAIRASCTFGGPLLETIEDLSTDNRADTLSLYVTLHVERLVNKVFKAVVEERVAGTTAERAKKFDDTVKAAMSPVGEQ